jgi:hypothetical protein
MFNTELKQRVRILEDIVSNHGTALLMIQATMDELVYFKKQNQVLKSRLDELNTRFEALLSLHNNLSSKVEHIK